MTMDEIDSPTGPLDEAPKPSLKRLGGAAVGLLQGHLELLGIEFQDEKSRTFQLFIFSGVSLILGLLVMMAVATAILIMFWDSYRLEAAWGISLFFIVGLVASIMKTLQLARKGESPFQATVEELARNREQLLP
jgi:uncharacterized membrane protein YqjE